MRACSLITMIEPIEFFEVPDEYEIELEFANNRRNRKMRCRCDISHNNVVTEVYDDSYHVIATSMQDLIEMGVCKATVIALHEIDFGEHSPVESFLERRENV